MWTHCQHQVLFLFNVGMCESRNPKYNNLRTSSVEELDNPIPGLFRVLTEEPDPSLRWTTYTYPAHLDLLYFKPRGSHDFGLDMSSNLGQYNSKVAVFNSIRTRLINGEWELPFSHSSQRLSIHIHSHSSTFIRRH